MIIKSLDQQPHTPISSSLPPLLIPLRIGVICGSIIVRTPPPAECLLCVTLLLAALLVQDSTRLIRDLVDERVDVRDAARSRIRRVESRTDASASTT